MTFGKVTLIALVMEGSLVLLGLLLLRFTGRTDFLNLFSPGKDFWFWIAAGIGAGFLAVTWISAAYRLWLAFARSIQVTVRQVFGLMELRTLVVISFLAALGEEFFFRGVLQPVIGVTGASLIFAVLHSGFRRELWAYGLTAFIISVIFGLLYHVGGELWAAVAAHATYNLVTSFAISRKFFDPAAPSGPAPPAVPGV